LKAKGRSRVGWDGLRTAHGRNSELRRGFIDVIDHTSKIEASNRLVLSVGLSLFLLKELLLLESLRLTDV